MTRIRFVITRSCFAITSLTIGVATASAQSSKLPNPGDLAAAVPAVKYESAFSDFKPFREEKIRSWKEVNQEVADTPGMHSMDMKGMHGSGISGMDSKSGDAAMSKEGPTSHDIGSMKDMPGKSMPGMHKQAPTSRMNKQDAAGHDIGSMKDMPAKSMRGVHKQTATAPKSKDGHDKLAMAKPHTEPGPHADAKTTGITGTGVVQDIDKANSKVKLTHDPIAAMGWPKMTMFFRLRDNSLADQVKVGDKVQFSLEKMASGYVISGFQKGAAIGGMK
jgi:Cu/Ag efflux protein CusF